MKVRKTLAAVIAAIVTCAGLAWAAVAVSIEEWSLPEGEEVVSCATWSQQAKAIYIACSGRNKVGVVHVAR